MPSPPADALRAERAELFLRLSAGRAEPPKRRASASESVSPTTTRAVEVGSEAAKAGARGFFVLGEIARRLSGSGPSSMPQEKSSDGK